MRPRNNFSDLVMYFEDERFTSKMAKDSILPMGMKEKDRQRKELVDELCVLLILQACIGID